MWRIDSYNASGSYNFIAEKIHYCTYTENQYVTETGGGEEEENNGEKQRRQEEEGR